MGRESDIDSFCILFFDDVPKIIMMFIRFRHEWVGDQSMITGYGSS